MDASLLLLKCYQSYLERRVFFSQSIRVRRLKKSGLEVNEVLVLKIPVWLSLKSCRRLSKCFTSGGGEGRGVTFPPRGPYVIWVLSSSCDHKAGKGKENFDSFNSSFLPSENNFSSTSKKAGWPAGVGGESVSLLLYKTNSSFSLLLPETAVAEWKIHICKLCPLYL